MNRAAHNGITYGYGNGRFGSDDNLTREQLAAIIHRYQQFSGKIPPDALTVKVFTDWAQISDYAKDAVNVLTMQGIISGKPGNLFDPGAYVARAEIAAILHRFLEAVE